MKNKGIYIVVVIILIIVIIIGIAGFDKKEIKSVEHFYYSYSSGMEYNGGVVYKLDCNNKCSVIVKRSGEALEDIKDIDVDQAFVNKLINILNKYNVVSWNGFDKNDMNVLDGSSFSLSITTKENYSIEAHGYMKWPVNFHEVDNELEELFESVR